MNRALLHTPPWCSHPVASKFSYLHTGDANAHRPNDLQVLLNEGLQLTDTATLVGEQGGGPDCLKTSLT